MTKEGFMDKAYSNPGGAPIGNKNGVKLKDPEVRQNAYKSYCEHLAKGKSKRSWCFEHPQLTCTWQTIEEYIKDEVEFNPIHIQTALSKGYAKWEQIVEDGAEGTNPDVNPACLQMVMRNKFGWDKQREGNNEHRGDIGRLADALSKFESSSDRGNTEIE
jgi:hypothetical protein